MCKCLCKNNQLKASFTIFEKRDTIYRLSSWEAGLAIEQFNKNIGYWSLYTGNADYLLKNAEFDMENTIVFSKIINTIPIHFQSCASRATFLRFTLLMIMRRAAGFFDIMKDNPALALLLAYKVAQKVITIDTAANLVWRKRHELLNAINGSCSEAEVRALGRISFNTLKIENLLWLNLFVQQKTGYLKHFSQYLTVDMPIEMLWFVIEYPGLFACRFFRRLHNKMKKKLKENSMSISIFWQTLFSKNIVDTYTEAVFLGKALHISDYSKNIERKKTLKSLHKLTDKWGRLLKKWHRQRIIDSVKKQAEKSACDNDFPPFPLPANLHVEPITTLHDLCKEGDEMNKCISFYEDDIYSGSVYFYRVLFPHRGTLIIDLTKESPVIREFTISTSCCPSPESRRVVEEWINSGLYWMKASSNNGN
ncbi:MAG: hypothetical protein GF401_19630 [Chitinivibrionales bacterium]|nr:hypothetical protein [Chitinivibrionales bacterium]